MTAITALSQLLIDRAGFHLPLQRNKQRCLRHKQAIRKISKVITVIPFIAASCIADASRANPDKTPVPHPSFSGQPLYLAENNESMKSTPEPGGGEAAQKEIMVKNCSGAVLEVSPSGEILHEVESISAKTNDDKHLLRQTFKRKNGSLRVFIFNEAAQQAVVYENGRKRNLNFQPFIDDPKNGFIAVFTEAMCGFTPVVKPPTCGPTHTITNADKLFSVDNPDLSP